jgi:hypothetical protein
MAKFNLDSTDPAIDRRQLEASSWSGALSKVLSKFKGDGSVVQVDINEDGHTELWQSDSDTRLHLDAEADTGFELLDDPTTDLWDAPRPGSGSQTAHQPSPVDKISIQEGLTAIANADTDVGAADIALDLILKHVPAESGSILLAEGSGLRFVAVRGPKAEALEGRVIGIDQGIAGACAQSGSALMIRSTRGSDQHDATVDHSVNHITRALLALPLSNGDQVLGVLELLNPFGADTFAQSHQGLARDVSAALAHRFTIRD